MKIEMVTLLLAMLGASAGAYTDIKKGIVPNFLTFPLIVIGVGLHFFEGFLLSNWWMAASGAIGAGIAFAFGYLFWLFGGWGGGDVKLLTALGALLPIYPNSLKGLFSPVLAPYSYQYPAFAFTIFFNSILGVFPFILAYVVYVCTRHPNFLVEMIQPFKSIKKFLEVPIVLIAAGTIGALFGKFFNSSILFFSITLFISFILFVIPFLPRVIFSVLVTGYAFLKNPFIIGLLFLQIFGIILGVAILIKSLSVIKKDILESKVQITGLKEGDIPAEVIYIDGGTVKRDTCFNFSSLKQVFKNKDFSIIKSIFTKKYEKILANPKVAAGLTKEEIEELQKLVKAGKLENWIKIKKVMPFAPAILLGLLISIIFGDVFWWLIS